LALEALEQRALLSAGLLDLNLGGTAGGNLGALESSVGRQLLSTDGHYAVFQSNSTDLVAPGIDVNGIAPDIFVRDRVSGTTQTVSLRDGLNVTGDNGSHDPIISPDGRYVVFESVATDLVPNEPRNAALFLRDLQANRTFLLGPGVTATAGGNDAVFSANSQFVAYTSAGQVYVRNLSAATTTLVSINTNGTGPATGTSDEPAISADGRYVAFASIASDLVPSFFNAFSTRNIFLRDLQTGTTTVVTHGSSFVGNVGGNGDSINPHLSDNGRTLVFQSFAYNLGVHVTDSNGNSNGNILAYDLPSGSLSLVSVNAKGTGGGINSSFNPVISAGGRYVAFDSLAYDLTTVQVAGGPGVASKNVYVRDLQTGITTLVSIDNSHKASGNSESGLPSISADGRMISFESRSTDLIPNFVQNHPTEEIGLGVNFDVYQYDQQTGTASLLSNDYQNPAGSSNRNAGNPVMSADGSSVIFQSIATNLDPRTDGQTHLFVSPPNFVAPVTATGLSMVPSVTTVTAGSPFSITVTVVDSQNNTVASYTGTVHFLTIDGATLPADYTFTSSDQGTHTFDGVVLTRAGNQTVRVTDTANSITGDTAVEVTPAAATEFSLTAPAASPSGMPFDLTVTALDPFGNIDTNYTGTVQFSSTDGDPGVG
jgi:hypothetical protein